MTPTLPARHRHEAVGNPERLGPFSVSGPAVALVEVPAAVASMTEMANVTYAARATVDVGELQALFVRAWDGNGKPGYDRVLRRSFTWIAAYDDQRLVGFVNVAWDGGVHFFLLDTTVDPDYRRRGIGTELVRRATDACRGHGEWLHVDSDVELMERLYFPAGFAPATAGTIELSLDPYSALA